MHSRRLPPRPPPFRLEPQEEPLLVRAASTTPLPVPPLLHGLHYSASTTPLPVEFCQRHLARRHLCATSSRHSTRRSKRRSRSTSIPGRARSRTRCCCLSCPRVLVLTRLVLVLHSKGSSMLVLCSFALSSSTTRQNRGIVLNTIFKMIIVYIIQMSKNQM